MPRKEHFPVGSTWKAEDREGNVATIRLREEEGANQDWCWTISYKDGSVSARRAYSSYWICYAAVSEKLPFLSRFKRVYEKKRAEISNHNPLTATDHQLAFLKLLLIPDCTLEKGNRWLYISGDNAYWPPAYTVNACVKAGWIVPACKNIAGYWVLNKQTEAWLRSKL